MSHEFDRSAELLAGIRDLVQDAERIAGRGREAFFDPEDRTLRLAAQTILRDLQATAELLPQAFRDQHPDVPWDELQAMTNQLAEGDANADYLIVWNALERDLPQLVHQLGIDQPRLC